RSEWVVATQEPPGCDGYGRACAVVGNEIGGNLEARADRRAAPGGEGAAVLPGDVVHHRPGHGVEPRAPLGIQPRDRGEEPAGVAVAGVVEQRVARGALDDLAPVEHV